jgi:regulatory protein
MKSEVQIVSSLAKYCSLAERCLSDVRKKIRAEGLSEDAEKRIIDRLLREKFIDEKRFVRSFVNDKFRFNHWGRIKIAQELKMRDIKPDHCQEALEAIDANEYFAVLNDILAKKRHTVKGRSPQDTFWKLCRFAVSKGFEMPLIIDALKDSVENSDDAW